MTHIENQLSVELGETKMDLSVFYAKQSCCSETVMFFPETENHVVGGVKIWWSVIGWQNVAAVVIDHTLGDANK